MCKSKLINVSALLLLVVFLHACARTTQVEFEPTEPQQEDVTPAETSVTPPDEPPEPPEIKSYSTDIAGTAEQLYGTDPGSSKNADYMKAVETNPMLKYTVIYFDFNKSAIKSEAQEILSYHASFMATYPEVRLRLEGHADQRGTSGYNLALGESRANAVRTILEAYGISSSRISVISFGEEQPAAEGNTEEAFRLNRRVELIYP